MKLLLSVVLLALFTISFAQQTIPCATEAAQACATSFATCAQGAIDGQTSPCDCFRTYGQCLLGLGCAQNSQEIVNFQLQCQAATCGNDICILAVPTQTIPATTVAQCDATAATACQQAYTTCTQAIATTVNVNQLGDQPQVESTTVATVQPTVIVVPTNQLCTCLETYGTCLRVAGCSSGSFAESFNQICSSSQCAPSVCQTISIGQAVCSSSVVASCQNAFSTCSQHQGSLGLCNCYAAYGTCLTTAGCSGDALTQFRNQCTAANCSPNICGTSAVLPASCAFCTLTRTQCIPTGDDAQLEEICNCFETERLCLTQNNCTSTSDYQNFLINCRVANCDASVCGPAVVSTCNTQAAAQCAQQFTNCSQLINTQFSLTLSGDNQDILRQQRQALCTCYSTWGVCLRNNNCLSGVEHDAFRQNCQIANCGNDICGTQPVGSPANKINPKTLWVGISVAALFGISLL